MKSKAYKSIEFLMAAAFVIVLGGLLLIGPTLSYSSVENAQITVKDKERVCDGSGNSLSCRYLVYTEQGVYENTDSLIQFKFNSSDVYNELEAGNTYDVEVNWFRVPFLSMYENILEIRGEVE